MANTKKRIDNIFPLTQRPELPDDLTGDAAELWLQVVNSLPAGYLRPGDLPLLKAYCIAAATYAEAQDLLTKEGVIAKGKTHPALQICDSQAKLMMALAGKLRLCPSSRTRPDAAGLRRAHQGAVEESDKVARFFT